MANRLYDLGRESFLKGEISWSGDNIKACLVDSASYTPDTAVDQFFDDVSGVVATSSNLASKTTTGGVADAADVTFSAVTGNQSELIVIYQDTGTPSTSRLVAVVDTATGLPVTPNGGDIVVQWDAAVNKIFKL